jgi:hypothetical protein
MVTVEYLKNSPVQSIAVQYANQNDDCNTADEE